jgi:hypothetical protein
VTSRWASHFYALSAHPGANTHAARRLVSVAVLACAVRIPERARLELISIVAATSVLHAAARRIRRVR